MRWLNLDLSFHALTWAMAAASPRQADFSARQNLLAPSPSSLLHAPAHGRRTARNAGNVTFDTPPAPYVNDTLMTPALERFLRTYDLADTEQQAVPRMNSTARFDYLRAHAHSPHERTLLALSEAYASREAIDDDSALRIIEDEARQLDKDWLRASAPATDSRAQDSNQRRASRPSRRERQARRHLAAAATLYARLTTEPTLNATALATLAGNALDNTTSPNITEEAVATYHINRLADHINLRSLCRHSLRSKLDLLQSVHIWLGAVSPSYDAPLLDPRAIRLAATLHHRCQSQVSPAGTASPALTGADIAAFRTEIALGLRAQEDGQALIPWETLPPVNRTIWFDGLAIRGAAGLTLDGITSMLARTTTLPAETLKQVITLRLTDLRESMLFPIGMPQQSIHSIVLRLAPLHNMRLEPGEDFASIMRNFNALCARWAVSPAYTLSPTLSAALHLAHASGVVVFSPGDPAPQILARLRTRYRSVAAESGTVIAPLNTTATPANVTDAIPWETLQPLALQPDDPSQPDIVRRLAAGFRMMWNASEVRIAANQTEAEASLIDYFHERLNAYRPLPSYDKNATLLDMWRQEDHMPERYITATRNIPCAENSRLMHPKNGLPAALDCQGTVLDDMHRRENMTGFNKYIRIGRRRVTVADENARALAFYQHALQQNPLIRAHAEELIRLTGQAITANQTDVVAKSVAKAAAGLVTTPVAPTMHDGPAAALMHTLDNLIIGKRWPTHILEVLQRGNPREIIGLLPFIIPAVDIEEGIRLGNRSRALNGVLQFSVDALMTWLGGKITARLNMPAAAPTIPRAESIAMSMLDEGMTTLGTSEEYRFAISDIAENVASAVTDAARRTSLPLRYRPFDARMRAGEILHAELLNMPNARMTYLPAEDCIVPFAKDGNKIVRLNWDGHVIGELSDDLMSGMKSRLLEAFPDEKPPVALSEEQLGARHTVQEIRTWMTLLDDSPPPTNVITYDEAETRLGSLIDIHPVNSNEVDFFAVLKDMYMHSPTLRRIVHHAEKHPTRQPLRLLFESGIDPHYYPDQHLISVPPAAEIQEITYRARTGVMTFDEKAVWLHEVIHAFTLLSDPPAALASHNRGPVVYLTDLILFECNHIPPERIVYAGPLPHESVGSYTPGTMARWRTDANIVVQENLALDALIAQNRPIWAAREVLGTEVQRRATVRAAVKIENAVSQSVGAELPRNILADRIASTIRIAHPSTADSIHPSRWARNLAREIKTLYQETDWGRTYLDQWLTRTEGKTWSLRVIHDLQDAHGPVPYRVYSTRQLIEVSSAYPFSYLSATGPRKYTSLRRTAGILAEIALPRRVSMQFEHEGRFARGAVVYVENKLLGLNDASANRRVSATHWNDAPENCQEDPTMARRAADEEDRYLRSICSRRPGGECTCLR